MNLKAPARLHKELGPFPPQQSILTKGVQELFLPCQSKIDMALKNNNLTVPQGLTYYPPNKLQLQGKGVTLRMLVKQSIFPLEVQRIENLDC